MGWENSIFTGDIFLICILTTPSSSSILFFALQAALQSVLLPRSLSVPVDLLSIHSLNLSGLHRSHVICALRIRGASEDDNMGGHQGLSKGLLAHSRRIIRWNALRVSICIFAPPNDSDIVWVWC